MLPTVNWRPDRAREALSGDICLESCIWLRDAVSSMLFLACRLEGCSCGFCGDQSAGTLAFPLCAFCSLRSASAMIASAERSLGRERSSNRCFAIVVTGACRYARSRRRRGIQCVAMTACIIVRNSVLAKKENRDMERMATTSK